MSSITNKVFRVMHHSKIRIPLISKYASSKFIKHRYADEFSLMRGEAIPNCQKNSVVFFTTHKAASVFAGSVLRRMARLSGYKCIHYEACAFAGGDLPYPYEQYGEWSKSIYPSKGYFFGPFRRFHSSIPWINDGRMILHLRDPRDVLVSLYYSLRYSHSMPHANEKIASHMKATRDEVSKVDINKFVLAEALRIRKEYMDYLDGMAGMNAVWFSKYEDMVEDFEGWLIKASQAMGIENSKWLIKMLMEMQSFSTSENKKNHKRQVQPGDHLRKLDERTIENLNGILEEILLKTGYSITKT